MSPRDTNSQTHDDFSNNNRRSVFQVNDLDEVEKTLDDIFTQSPQTLCFKKLNFPLRCNSLFHVPVIIPLRTRFLKSIECRNKILRLFRMLENESQRYCDRSRMIAHFLKQRASKAFQGVKARLTTFAAKLCHAGSRRFRPM